VRTRARFDPEYLGLEIPGVAPTVEPDHRLAQDLRRLDATEREWEEFRELKSDRQAQLERLETLLLRHGLDDAGLRAEIVRRNPGLAGRESEAIRALVLAFLCDVGGVRSLAEARHHMRDWIDFLAAGGEPQHPARRGWPRPSVGDSVERAWPLVVDDEQREDDDLRRRFRTSIARGTRDDLERLEVLAEFSSEHSMDGDALERHILDTLFGEANGPSSWTEQIIAVRTVQSLGMIDLAGYEHAILQLGGYPPWNEPADALATRQL